MPAYINCKTNIVAAPTVQHSKPVPEQAQPIGQRLTIDLETYWLPQ